MTSLSAATNDQYINEPIVSLSPTTGDQRLVITEQIKPIASSDH